MTKKLLLIANPKAGLRRVERELPRFVNYFSHSGYEPLVCETTARGEGKQFAKEHAAEADLVIACGGDGTLNEVIDGILHMEEGKRPPLGYIPCGTTNDFAASLHLPDDPMAAAAMIVQGRPHTIDVGCFNGRYFSYVASFGAFTGASYNAPQAMKNALGYMAYIVEGVKDIPNIQPRHLQVVANGMTFENDYIFGAFSNSTSIAGLVKLGENMVDFNDGLLEVMLVVMPQNVRELNKIMLSLTKREYNNEMVHFFHTNAAQVHTDGNLPWALDGEYEPGGEWVNIQNIPSAIQLIY